MNDFSSPIGVLIFSRLMELRAKHGDDAQAAAVAVDGIVLGFELAAVAARQRGLDSFAIELDLSAQQLQRSRP